MKKRSMWRVFAVTILIGVMSAALLLGGCGQPASDGGGNGDGDGDANPAAPSRVSIRWNTSDVGSYGYSVASMMSDFLNRELPNKLEGSNYVVTVHPFPSTGVAMKSVMDGEGEISYTADVGMTQVYDRSGPYENWDPGKTELVHSFYAYPMETSLAVFGDKADQYSSWGDLSGEPVFFTPAGFMNWLNMGRIFNALGYEFNHTEIDSGMVADALRDGSIVGAAIYTTAGRSLPTYLREAEMRIDLTAVSPTEEEKQKLIAAGLTPVKIDPKNAFSQDMGVDEYWGVPILFGYNVMPEIPADFVKAMLEIFEENADSLVKLDAGFGPMAADFVGMQVSGIKANPHIPVHAGMAEFLKDKGVWDDSWTIAD